jgi:hypothetical protein
MMIRDGGWRYDDGGPPASRPLYSVSIVLIAVWAVALATLLVSVGLWFLRPGEVAVIGVTAIMVSAVVILVIVERWTRN